MRGPSDSAAAAQLDALTGSRFVAAYAILILHGQVLGYSVPAWLDLAQAVSYFFVLSGFILFYRYPELVNRDSVLEFYRHRFARIWPVHGLTLALGVATVFALSRDAGPTIPWVVLPLQVMLVNAWIPDERFVFGFNPPAWTISVEWFFYALFPLLVWRWPRTWTWKIGGAIVVLMMLVVVSYVADLPPTTGDGETNRVSTLALLYANPLARLFEFLLGMAAALGWYRFGRAHTLSASAASAFEIALLCAIAADLYWTGHKASDWSAMIARRGFDWRVLTATPLGTGACLLYAALIALLATGKGILAKTLARPLCVVLGESSYSLYMLHAFLLLLITRTPAVLQCGVACRTTTAFTIMTAVAYAVWRFVERPARYALLRRR